LLVHVLLQLGLLLAKVYGALEVKFDGRLVSTTLRGDLLVTGLFIELVKEAPLIVPPEGGLQLENGFEDGLELDGTLEGGLKVTV